MAKFSLISNTMISLAKLDTKTNTNPNPDPNRYRMRCPDPNARIQKFIYALHAKRIAPIK